MDMFACFWWAIDEDNRAWCIRSLEIEGLNVQDAAREGLNHTLAHENIVVTYAPPDMWNRQKESGKTIADIFSNYGMPLIRSDNNRVQGHMIMRSMLDPIPLHDPYVIEMYGGDKKAPKTLPALMFFDTVGGAIEDIQSIQHDELNPNDCSKDPHDITHTVDGIRYFCINRSMPSELPKKAAIRDEFDGENGETYEDYMTGGEVTEEYINY